MEILLQLGNHDNWRISARVGAEYNNAFNMISLTLPGVAVTYYGEEIGMNNNMDITFEETVDPSGVNCGPDHYNDEPCSRDPERTPMQWTPGVNAGFNDGGSTWLPVNKDYVDINVLNQELDPDSTLNVYRAVAELRKQPTFIYGGAVTQLDGDVLSVARKQTEIYYDVYVTMANFGTDAQTVDLFGDIHPFLETGVVMVSSLGSQGDNPVG